MNGILLSHVFASRYAQALDRIERETGQAPERIILPARPEERLLPDRCARVEAAFFSPDVMAGFSPQFFAAAHAASELRWLHVFNTGVDHPVFRRFFERGVALTNAPWAHAGPIAQTAVTGMLMLARGFPHWLEAQRARRWSPIAGDDLPYDLCDQTLVIVGTGAIGMEAARLAKAFGLHVVGVRRSVAPVAPPLDEVHSVVRLPELLPRADWLLLACPLDAQTRGLIDAAALARLPRGARLLNVGRGELVDEAALIGALEDGHLAGAYLDVFHSEPLPEDSPLWTLPRVIVTPHNSAAARGNAGRQVEGFFENYARWLRKEPLEHVIPSPSPSGA